ncbi:PilZ domain-containing protein [Myxococcota bacterium]
MVLNREKKPKIVSQVTRLKDRVAQFVARGDWSRALRTLLIIQEHSPRDMYIARKVGEMYQRMGRTKEAVEAYKSAAKLYAEEGFLYKAISVNKIILSLHPDDQDVAEALAALQSRQTGHRMFDLEHDDSIEPTTSSKVVGVYLDRVSKETLLWIPLISELQEEELSRVIDMMVRKKKRLSIMKRVDFEHSGEARFAYTRDLSSGGTYLRAQQLVPENTDLVLDLKLEEDQEPVSVGGSVVRSTSRGDQKGFGVRFHQDGQDQALKQVSEFVLSALEKQGLEQVKKNSKDVDALYELAEIAREKRDLAQTEKYLRRITEIKSPSVAHGFLAEVLLHRALEEDDEELIREAHDLFAVALKLENDDALEGARTALQKRMDHYHSMLTELPREELQEELEQLDIEVDLAEMDDLADPGDGLESRQASVEKIERALAARLADLEDREKRLKGIEKELEETRESLRLQAEEMKTEEAKLNVLKSSIDQRRREVEHWAQDLMAKEKALIKKSDE